MWIPIVECKAVLVALLPQWNGTSGLKLRTYVDIYNFLINTTGYCTHERLKAYKSLDGYNFFVNGWVSNIDVISSQATKTKVFILMSLVTHSHHLIAPPLKVWVATKQQGEVLCAHCTCMAGLGETCSHIAALLFTVAMNTQLKVSFLPHHFPVLGYHHLFNQYHLLK